VLRLNVELIRRDVQAAVVRAAVGFRRSARL
jgi:hypothetical protein